MKQIKYETTHENRLSTEIFTDTLATKRLFVEICKTFLDDDLNKFLNNPLNGYVHEISFDPYGFLCISNIQVNRFF